MDRTQEYAEAMTEAIRTWAKRLKRPAATLYFGGGTPSLLGATALVRLIAAARESFALPDGAEITVECNPDGVSPAFFQDLSIAGVNRISLGMQSAVPEELQALGRRHSAQQVISAVQSARAAGISSVSLDLMLGIPAQTKESLLSSVRFCAEAGATHISAYLLKLEPGTSFYKNRESLHLPDEETVCALYLTACEELERLGFAQYEISNFAKPDQEGQHNLIYWHGEEYLGLGPAAHSFLMKHRFHFSASLRDFLLRKEPQEDFDNEIPAGSFEEYALLGLRLNEGLTDAACLRRFGHPIPAACWKKARQYEAAGLTKCSETGFAFTREGFLVSNALLTEILSE